MVRLRIVIVDPVESTRESLAMLLADLGHEVVAFEEPVFCPGYASDRGCSYNDPCGDVLIISQHLPRQKGLQFIRERLRGGCRGLARRMFLVCDPNADTTYDQAQELGAKPLKLPLDRNRLEDLLTAIADELSPTRRLVSLEKLHSTPRP